MTAKVRNMNCVFLQSRRQIRIKIFKLKNLQITLDAALCDITFFQKRAQSLKRKSLGGKIKV
jgi:hypothetical protein